jgi:hypothetical protein
MGQVVTGGQIVGKDARTSWTRTDECTGTEIDSFVMDVETGGIYY